MSTHDGRDLAIVRVYEKHIEDLKRMCLRYVNYDMSYSDAIADCIQDAFLLAEQTF